LLQHRLEFTARPSGIVITIALGPHHEEGSRIKIVAHPAR
jgi:hypothetical protein